MENVEGSNLFKNETNFFISHMISNFVKIIQDKDINVEYNAKLQIVA